MQETRKINKPEFQLTKEELIHQLDLSRQETAKYVNKFLERQEKWEFVNDLLKKLTVVRQKGELCDTFCQGFFQLTNSRCCYCCLFNPDTHEIEISGLKHCDDFVWTNFSDFTSIINRQTKVFLSTTLNEGEIFKFFHEISQDNIIVVPILHANSFLGYLLLKNDEENFYNDNINFVNVFPEHIALILENISLYQESEKENKRKIEFLAGLSHEFKTPLNAIIGFSEILKMKFTNNILFNEFEKNTDNILLSAKHLLSLIEDIIDISKFECNKLELNYSTFKPQLLITNVLNSLNSLSNEKQLNITYTFASISIEADVTRFRQVIYNLLSNAIKFNKKGGSINILTYVNDKNFYFEITDTGDGISKRDYDKIFNFFSQVNRNQLKRQHGSGIGLAMCKMIVKSHKGEIGFKSKLKKGSIFWFSIPINRSKVGE